MGSDPCAPLLQSRVENKGGPIHVGKLRLNDAA
jgi:hypothetical protein